ncbi:helix-turn-helix transcriptional regulator [Lacticaseibacillus parakribbianus]|uniref:helix-turn-helix transcriptional regulator n=1 Tax=Lacticaseibacillus parakribbianus TaxID=2970927 RepID=UPI0021CB0158|nr:WYL domain-containing protein [Lacticaseibacillus parakribbianus]
MANSAYRQVYILLHLVRHVPLNKQQLSKHFAVTERSIQRDISQLNALFDHEEVAFEVQYNQRTHAFELQSGASELNSAQLVVLIKILLASRALNAEEAKALIANLLQTALPSERRVINRVIQNEVFNYLPLHHNQPLTGLIWQFSLIITRGQTVLLSYRSRNGKESSVLVAPKAIFFSDHYFYLIAVDQERGLERFYRFDRIQDYRLRSEDGQANGYTSRYPEGELRRYLPIMAGGPRVTVTFDFWGRPDAALDWLPTASIITQDAPHHKVTIQATVYTEAFKMWLLSQGNMAKLLTPPSLVAELTRTVGEMNDLYHDTLAGDPHFEI